MLRAGTENYPGTIKGTLQRNQKNVATLRGLQPKPDFEIAAQFLAISQLAANADSAGAISTVPLAQLERAYKQLGLLSANDDFKTELENFHRLERLISHDSAKEQILIAADTARLSSELPAPYDRAPPSCLSPSVSSTRCNSSISNGKKRLAGLSPTTPD